MGDGRVTKPVRKEKEEITVTVRGAIITGAITSIECGLVGLVRGVAVERGGSKILNINI